MSEEVSIQVTISGRKYPLTVASKDADMIKSIAAELDTTISALKKNYAVQDKQDLLAMAALQVAVKKASGKPSPPSEEKELPEQVVNQLELLAQKSEKLLSDF